MGKFFRTRAFIAMCIIAVLMLGLCLYSMTGREKVSVFENIFGIIITPIQKASNRLVSASGNFNAVFTEYDTLKAENEQLQEKLNEAEEKLRQAEQHTVENKSMREMLGIAEEREDMKFAMAHVIARGQNGYSQTLTLDKGSLQGLSAKDMVITGSGIVGYISEVGLTWAKVTTILDSSCEIGVILTRTQDAGVLQGNTELAKDGRCKIAYLKNDVSLTVGDSAETSGVGGIFPKGLFVGRIKEIKSETTGLAQYAVIEPAVSINELDTVFVVTEFGQINEEKGN